ncbi:hypothetical protein RJ639_009322 [Escallonia herrerae]|uniref:Uncharacterized protein n=1 Tax=Escallonia herrerae TaxID=1293975 RepID=A0AA89AR35_9ASTE|nr:hypothetical protein RJ639_009322 [Escallonia herrerae]
MTKVYTFLRNIQIPKLHRKLLKAVDMNPDVVDLPRLDDWIPKNGMEFNSWDEAWKFWVDYGGKMGFGMRKDYSNKSRKDEITLMESIIMIFTLQYVFIFCEVKEI